MEFASLHEFIETPEEVLDYEEASGLLIRVAIPATGFAQFIGPYSKDNPDALAVIERLRSEVYDCDEAPVEFSVHLLFPPSFAEPPA